MPIPQVNPEEVKRRLDADPGALVLLDIRRPDELLLAEVPGAVHVPMNEVPQALDRLERSAEYVVMCHHGIRSTLVCNYLRTRGYPRVSNLRGGIEAWSQEADPTVGRY